MNWFEIDKKGLAQILARKGKEFAIFELVQNAWDEPSVTKVEVTLQPESHAYARLTVRDDAPNGFQRLSDAYTLFAPSKKKGDPEKRGRFNLGEKLVLALSREARIATTTGTIIFNDKGRRQTSTQTVVGSEISVVFRMTKDEMERAARACLRLIPPLALKTYINGVPITSAPFSNSFEASLITEISNVEGELIKVTRKTIVEVYDADSEHPAAIYEMGIPVCEIEGKYVFNVMQKVPLTMDREEVLPQFRKQLAVAALNCLAHTVDTEDVNTGWATEAVSSPDVLPEALNAYMTQKFGEKRVSFDPSDPESNHTAAAAGYTVITGSQLGKDAWKNVKSVGAVTPAGQIFPTPNPFSPNGKPMDPAKMTDKIRAVKAYTEKFAREVCGINISVDFRIAMTGAFAACYGSRLLIFNVGRLGYEWLDLEKNQVAIDDLIIHELGHEYCKSHLDKNYNDALSGIGAKLAKAIREGRL
jgi:hypothetical protein